MMDPFLMAMIRAMCVAGFVFFAARFVGLLLVASGIVDDIQYGE